MKFKHQKYNPSQNAVWKAKELEKCRNSQLEEMRIINYSNQFLGKRGHPMRKVGVRAESRNSEPRVLFPLESGSGDFSKKISLESVKHYFEWNMKQNLKHFHGFGYSTKDPLKLKFIKRGRKSPTFSQKNENFPRIRNLQFDAKSGHLLPEQLPENNPTISSSGLAGEAKEGASRVGLRPPKKTKEGHFWVRANLANLLSFLVSLFTYERRSPDFSKLSESECEVLINVVRIKNYVCKEKLIETLSGARRLDRDLWIRLKKERRKEEHLKYGFKMIFKQMQCHFLRDLFARNPNFESASADGDQKLFFYLQHFGRVSFNRDPRSLFEDLHSGKLTKTRAWKKLTKFVLPEMGVSGDLCGVKTINREFIKNVSQLRPFALEFLDRTIDVQLFLGYCWSADWNVMLGRRRLGRRDAIGIDILRKVGRVNRKEIKKLFSEWANLISRANLKRTRAKPELDHFELIKNSIRRSNFKFPWTFVEVWEASVETFLSFVEFVNFDYLPKSAKSDVNCRTRVPALLRRLLHAPLQHAQEPLFCLPQALRFPIRRRRFP